MEDIFNTSCVTSVSSCSDFSDYRLSDMVSANNAIIEFIKCSETGCRIGVRFNGLSHKTIVLGACHNNDVGYFRDAVIRIFVDGRAPEVASVF